MSSMPGTIEMDDGYVGGKEEGKIGRGSEEKVPIVVAVEERITEKGLKPGYTAIRAVPNLSGRYINKFAQSKIRLDSKSIILFHVQSDSKHVDR